MRHYPSYKVDDVLAEYAGRFYVLLDHAATFDKGDQRKRILASMFPSLSQADRSNVLRDLEPRDTTPKDNAILIIERDRKRLRRLFPKK